MKNILILQPVDQRHKDLLEAAAPGCRFVYRNYQNVTEEEVREANVIFGNPAPAMIGASANLELLQLESAGADPYMPKGVLDEKTVVTNATGAYSQSVAEHAFAMTLALQKNLHLYRDNQRNALWQDRGPVVSMSNATVVVVGMGDIGGYYARMCKALGAYVIGVRRRPAPCPDYADEVGLQADLLKILPRADVVLSVLPGTPATTHIYTDECFDVMKPTAIFLNNGRGSAVASDVIYRAVTEHKIAAAAIDVTEQEPLPADSPLWGVENLFITPHVSGGLHLAETFERIVAIGAHNLKAWHEGTEYKNVVDFATGYKK